MEGKGMEITLKELLDTHGVEQADSCLAILLEGYGEDCYIRPDLDQVITIEEKNSEAKIAVLDEEGLDDYRKQYAKAIEAYFENFNKNVGCGKCVPCREGTKRILEIVQRYISGSLKPNDLTTLRQLIDTLTDTAMCGIGKNAAKPADNIAMLLDDNTMNLLVNVNKVTGVDAEESGYSIIESKCKGCSKCARNCPVSAITGVVREPFTIDSSVCIRCGVCINACPFNAIEEV